MSRLWNDYELPRVYGIQLGRLGKAEEQSEQEKQDAEWS